MANRPANFKQRDLVNMLKAVEKIGKNVALLEVDPSGNLKIHVGTGNNVSEPIDMGKALRDAQATALHKKFTRV